MEFKVGDLVQLKSGGPIMTVAGAQEGGRVRCSWWSDKDQKFDEGYFPPATLKTASSGP